MGANPFEYANLAQAGFIEALYADYQKDPASVDPSWQRFFEGVAFGRVDSGKPQSQGGSLDLQVFHLIQAYRKYGHLAASFNPLDLSEKSLPPELSLESYGFSEAQLQDSVPTCGFLKEDRVLLKDLVDALKKTYAARIGIEYMDLQMPALEKWIQEKVEPHFTLTISDEEKKEILHQLNKSEILESFIHMKYPGQKRFSLEGGESLIPILAELIDKSGEMGVVELVLGMAHRGRLNVLANILGKSYSTLFHEFEGSYIPGSFEGSGDVKYHKGYSADLETRSKQKVHVVLNANPSHLEAVDPIVEGMTRAKQELKMKGGVEKIIPLLIHGDSAFAGQGVIYETMQLSKLTGYATGGTIHIIVNNQVGFTAGPKEIKSTRYCTDIAKAFNCPVFHVNGEHPEDCVLIARLAVEIRQRFHCDVFIELNCYRKYGHNESDEPGFTQPLEYKLIKSKKNVRDLYKEELIQTGLLSAEEALHLEEEFRASLEKALAETQKSLGEKLETPSPSHKKDFFAPVQTSASKQKLIELAEKFTSYPKDFQIHPKTKRLFEERLKMVQGDEGAKVIDWGMAEHLAYATLLDEGFHVRISGQDSRRGTFSHRHALIKDQETDAKYFPLSHLKEGQAKFDVFNSFLSENAVLGFEFGYSLSYSKALIIWEAQFGDFVNGAQVVIDQFIVCSEQKWNRLSSLTLFLPHGYEGQGPEHSSARLERFLQLTGNDNMQVAVPTTATQFFHLLRRQALQEVRFPLIILTPKMLLRYPLSFASLNRLTQGYFEPILDDPAPGKGGRLIFCSGKVYFDLAEKREKEKRDDITIIRIEQLYPLHIERLKELIQKYQSFKKCFWVQEEHQNMGAWEYIRGPLTELLPEKIPLDYAGRPRSSSAAAGSLGLHKKELEAFLQTAFGERDIK